MDRSTSLTDLPALDVRPVRRVLLRAAWLVAVALVAFFVAINVAHVARGMHADGICCSSLCPPAQQLHQRLAFG